MRSPCTGNMLLSDCCSATDCLGGFKGWSSVSTAALKVSDVVRLGTVRCVAGAVK